MFHKLQSIDCATNVCLPPEPHVAGCYLAKLRKTRVDIIESERGWGTKVDDVRYFDSTEDAAKFCDEFNSRNKPGPVPDWYMYAEVVSLHH